MNITFPAVHPGQTHDVEGFRIMTNMYSAPKVGEGKAAFHIPGHPYSSSYSIENVGNGWYEITHDSRGGSLFFEMGHAPWGMIPVCADRINGRRVAFLGLCEDSGNYCFSQGLDWTTYRKHTRENGGVQYYDTVPETLVRLASLYIL